MLNLICMVSMSLIFMDPDGTIGTDDMANHNNLYSGFSYSQSDAVITDGFAGYMVGYYEDEE